MIEEDDSKICLHELELGFTKYKVEKIHLINVHMIYFRSGSLISSMKYFSIPGLHKIYFSDLTSYLTKNILKKITYQIEPNISCQNLIFFILKAKYTLMVLVNNIYIVLTRLDTL